MQCLICDSSIRDGLACAECRKCRKTECRFLAVANIVLRFGEWKLSAVERRFWNAYRPKDLSVMSRRNIGIAEVREKLRISRADDLHINGGAGWALTRLSMRLHNEAMGGL